MCLFQMVITSLGSVNLPESDSYMQGDAADGSGSGNGINEDDESMTGSGSGAGTDGSLLQSSNNSNKILTHNIFFIIILQIQ